MSEEAVPTVAEVVESWNVPAEAIVAARIRNNILVAIERGYDDPQLVADLAVGPLVMALGQLEVDLADAHAADRRARAGARRAGLITAANGS